MVTKAAGTVEIYVPPPDFGRLELCVLGVTPYLHNRMSEKARHELFFPKGRKTTAEKATTLKHEPYEEFRASPYTLSDDDSLTLLAVMSSAFKGAMMTAALDLPGSSKAQIGRLVWVEGFYAPIWGDVKLHMSVTRNADVGHTPDIRTRAITPEWATVLTIRFVKPLITETAVMNLLATGGRSAGVGDWRPEKGKGTFGQFEVVNSNNPDFERIMKQDRAVQVNALEDAEPYDDESTELLRWFATERKKRGR
jgi:hypothetical protein